jgi:uncharacterized protein
MPVISSQKPYRVGRSRTGLGLFATNPIKKGTKIIRYFGPLLDTRKKKDDAVENKYLFELNDRWTIDGSVRKNVARYINHSCRPNAESDVKPHKRKVFIRAIKNIEPGEEINYDYGTEYFKAYLKPIGCKCEACERKRRKKRAEARAERLRLKARAERKALRKAEKEAAKVVAKVLAKVPAKSAERPRLEPVAKNFRAGTEAGQRNGKPAQGKPMSGFVLNGRSRSKVAARKLAAARPRPFHEDRDRRDGPGTASVGLVPTFAKAPAAKRAANVGSGPLGLHRSA